ncbi:hypothetical protein EG328_005013 [Venturia inaequalis]|uniref:Uncharacterized protein n=2 Tax=Venturia inaequalis TaxID=5025 RepID=A0A8H3VJ50_VENIN|nr:hypothetical protein EG328_005013 [Venturia inaequalis]KAE9989356.1 hypothetical protein EG327_002833 [Venturia inaequalis]
MPVETIQRPPSPPERQINHHQQQPLQRRHQRSGSGMPPQPFILTLRLDKASERVLTDVRTKYFPKHRNFLSGHLTLFHALPAAQKPVYHQVLTSLSTSTSPFTVGIKEPFPLGKKGVGLNVSSFKLRGLHDELLKRFRDEGVELTVQDQSRLRAHVTVQNKVGEEEAGRTLEEVKNMWVERAARAEGIVVWRYETSGEWTFLKEFEFKGLEER